jgi:RHS repeat-associated protein
MTTNQYTFNGDGQRVQIDDSQGTKKPIWDFQNILLETDGSNATQVVYTLEPAVFGSLISQRRGSTTSYYLFDALGSSRKLTSSAGSITDSYDFRAYGETYASSGSTVNIFRWVGELGYYLDIDRLAYFLRARPFNPVIARFLSHDPVGFSNSPWNLYEYSNSSPHSKTDPSGLGKAWFPANSRVCNESNRPIWVWPGDSGKGQWLPGGECTSWFFDNGDFFKIDNKWYKVGPCIAVIRPNGCARYCVVSDTPCPCVPLDEKPPSAQEPPRMRPPARPRPRPLEPIPDPDIWNDPHNPHNPFYERYVH